MLCWLLYAAYLIFSLDLCPRFPTWLGKNEGIKKWMTLKNRRRSCSRFATNLGNQVPEWMRPSEREEKCALKTANLGERGKNHSCPRPGPTWLHTLRPHMLWPPLRSYDQTRSHPVPRGPFLPAPHDATPLVSTERSTERDSSRPSSLWGFQTKAWGKLRKN
jgi:hypothetical protein